MSPPQRLAGMATDMAMAMADVDAGMRGMPLLTTTDPSMPIAPSLMQPITARAFGATEAGVTEAGATGAGATEAGAEVGGAGSDQPSRLSTRSTILPAAETLRPTAVRSAVLSGAWHRSGESG